MQGRIRSWNFSSSIGEFQLLFRKFVEHVPWRSWRGRKGDYGIPVKGESKIWIMKYNDFKGLGLSALGFGTMRLPLLSDGHTIDEERVAEMVDYAIGHGINYFDTAWPYHDGKSETVIGRMLARYPKEKWYLADKFPGHQHFAEYRPAETFERQLEKCGVDGFDFYLFHNITENSLADYMNPKWGILDYLVKQRQDGRIKHLGMSTHASPDTLRGILDGPYGEVVEFCQIQLNCLDWTLQDAKGKVALLNERNIPIWVMEPVRGGRLAKLPGIPVSHSFRWLQGVPGVTMTLSGMSDMAQMRDNIATFDAMSPLSEEEDRALTAAAQAIGNGVPCTACRYCCEGCPAGLDIPGLMNAYNDLSVDFAFTPMMYLESLPEEKRPASCLGCGACAQICPQGIDIPSTMKGLAELYDGYPKWSEICEQRNKIK